MRSDNQLHRTKVEIEEIREYRKLVRFAKEVMTGKHPRVKIPASMFPIAPGNTRSNPIIISSPPRPPPPATASSLKRKRSVNVPQVHNKPPAAPVYVSHPPTAPRAMLSLPSSNIDFSVDYYKVLGVEPHVTANSINRGYAHKASLYSPTAGSSAWRWTDKDQKVREKVKENWDRLENAKRVLTNQELRNAYDAGREGEVVTKKRKVIQNHQQRPNGSKTKSPKQQPKENETESFIAARVSQKRKAEAKQSRLAKKTKLTSKKTKVEHVTEDMKDLHLKSDSNSTGAVNVA